MTACRTSIALVSFMLCLAAGAPVARADQATPSALRGFSEQGTTAQRARERAFDAQLDASEMRGWLQRLAAEPNQLGSPHDKANAEFILSLYKQWGWDAHIERFDVLYPTPTHVALEMLAPTPFTARLHEPPVAGDAATARAGALPPYNVYGADGDVSAELVYANRGMPDDYEELARHGVDVKGKIVIVRYGGGWRGLKPQLAHQHGAVGCLIYSDPRDDGYFEGDAYPKGGWRPADGVQRGSVAKMMIYPGDPTTPGTGSTPGAKTLPLSEAATLLKIPVLPISYGDAQPLLAALDGPVAPPAWRGALPITYHIGAGPARLRMVVKSEWTRKPAYDVIATIKGSVEPDRWIVRGNHHDGWVFGAWDPLAGNIAMLGEAKAIGALLKTGWKPRRSIVYASWDGEEPGLLGSTEWAETHADALRRKAVLYVNSDTNARGFLFAEGSHSLQHLVNAAAGDVQDPEKAVSVRERMRAWLRVEGAAPDAKPEVRRDADIAARGGDVPIGALGSGSDYSAFLEHLGIASLNLGFGGEDDNEGIYHSRYDTFEHFDRFGDPGFKYGVALAQVAGRVVLRMADAQALPMRFSDFGETFAHYVAQLHELVAHAREQATRRDALLDAHAYALVSDPARPVAAPQRLGKVPDIDLAPLDEAARRLQASAKAFEAAYDAHAATQRGLNARALARLNEQMGRMEQALTYRDGLPGREWFKHMVYAPGLLTGYGVKTVPAVREALESHDWEAAAKYAALTARVLDGYCERLDAAAALMRGDKP